MEAQHLPPSRVNLKLCGDASRLWIVACDPTATPAAPGLQDLQPIIDNVISELLRTDGVRVTLRLEIDATAPGGFGAEDAAVVRDNAKTLKFRPDATGFAED